MSVNTVELKNQLQTILKDNINKITTKYTFSSLAKKAGIDTNKYKALITEVFESKDATDDDNEDSVAIITLPEGIDEEIEENFSDTKTINANSKTLAEPKKRATKKTKKGEDDENDDEEKPSKSKKVAKPIKKYIIKNNNITSDGDKNLPVFSDKSKEEFSDYDKIDKIFKEYLEYVVENCSLEDSKKKKSEAKFKYANREALINKVISTKKGFDKLLSDIKKKDAYVEDSITKTKDKLKYKITTKDAKGKSKKSVVEVKDPEKKAFTDYMAALNELDSILVNNLTLNGQVIKPEKDANGKLIKKPDDRYLDYLLLELIKTPNILKLSEKEFYGDFIKTLNFGFDENADKIGEFDKFSNTNILNYYSLLNKLSMKNYKIKEIFNLRDGLIGLIPLDKCEELWKLALSNIKSVKDYKDDYDNKVKEAWCNILSSKYAYANIMLGHPASPRFKANFDLLLNEQVSDDLMFTALYPISMMFTPLMFGYKGISNDSKILNKLKEDEELTYPKNKSWIYYLDKNIENISYEMNKKDDEEEEK